MGYDDTSEISPLLSTIGDADVDTPIVPPIPDYDARAVLYKTDDDSSKVVKFRFLSENGPVAGNVQPVIEDEEGYFILPPKLDPTGDGGVYLLELSPAGEAALAAAQGGNIYEYLTINIDGYEYRMQIVVNQSGDFSSLKEDALSNNGANVSGYEWHTEASGTGEGNRLGDTGSNEVWLSKNEAGAAWEGNFSTHGGNDSFSISNTHSQGVGIGEGGRINTSGGNDKVNINAGLYGMNKGEISNAEEVFIQAGKNGLHSEGLGEKNAILNAGDVDIKAKEKGIYAHEGENTIKASGTVDIDADKYGVLAKGFGSSNIIELSGDSARANITVTTDSPVWNNKGHMGLGAAEGANNIIRGGGGVQIEADYIGMGAGFNEKEEFSREGGSGSNTIEKVSGDVNISSQGIGLAGYGMVATGNTETGDFGTNTIRNVSGTVRVSSNHQKTNYDSETSAMYAHNGGKNTIDTVGGVLLETDGSSSGVMRVRFGENSITNVAGDVTLLGTGASTKGMYISSANASNTIENVTGTLRIATAGTAMHTNNSGSSLNGDNIIRNVGKDVIFETEAWGMATYNRGVNIIDKVKGAVRITADTTETGDLRAAAAHGMHVHGSYGGEPTHNDITNVAGAVSLTVKGRGNVSGMSGVSQGSGSYNLIENVGSVHIDAQETFLDYNRNTEVAGMKSNATYNFINDTGAVTMDISSIMDHSASVKKHIGYGLKADVRYASDKAGNYIQGVDSVRIEIDPDNFTEVYGMYSYYSSAINEINNSGYYVNLQGEKAYNPAFDKALTVTIIVPKGAYAMYGSNNSIIGSSKEDVIDLTGGINGKNAVISTGAGDDIVKLYGKIENLSLNMGDGEHDRLILRADDLDEFNNFYQTWLTNLLNKGGHGIEHIEVNGFDPQEFPSWLKDLCEEKGIGFEEQVTPVSIQGLMEDSQGFWAEAAAFAVLDDEANFSTPNEAPTTLANSNATELSALSEYFGDLGAQGLMESGGLSNLVDIASLSGPQSAAKIPASSLSENDSIINQQPEGTEVNTLKETVETSIANDSKWEPQVHSSHAIEAGNNTYNSDLEDFAMMQQVLSLTN